MFECSCTSDCCLSFCSAVCVNKEHELTVFKGTPSKVSPRVGLSQAVVTDRHRNTSNKYGRETNWVLKILQLVNTKIY